MKDLKISLASYLQVLEIEDKQFREKYKKENPGDCGFHYDKEKLKLMTTQEHMRIRNISEQKLHIKKLLKLMGAK